MNSNSDTPERDSEDKKAAESILESLDALFVPDHEYVSVRPEDFRELNIRFYDKNRKFLETEGFNFLGDQEDLTVSNSPDGVRTFIRCMVGDGDTISAGIYHFRPKLYVRILLWVFMKAGGKIIDFETEFTDGTWTNTSNAVSAKALDTPPEDNVEYLPYRTSTKTLLEEHRKRVAAYLIENPTVAVLKMKSLRDVTASQHRMEAIKAAFREKQGGVSAEELRRCAGGRDEVAEGVHAEVVKIKASQA